MFPISQNYTIWEGEGGKWGGKERLEDNMLKYLS